MMSLWTRLLGNMHVDLPTPFGFVLILFVSQTVSLLAPTNPVITAPLSANEGTQVTFNCSTVNGNPLPSVIWYKGSNIVDSTYSTGGQVSYNEYTFTASRSDHGVSYRCEVYNIALTSPLLRTWILTVYVQPNLPTISGPSLIYSGNTYTYSCVSSGGNPAPNINWRLDTTAFIQGIQNSIVPNIDNTYTMTSNLTWVPVVADNGKALICEVEHSPTLQIKLTDSIAITVQGEPSVTVNQTSYSILYGESVTLHCTVTAIPNITSVYWSKSVGGSTENITMTTNTTKYGGTTISNPSLQISNLVFSDTGSYVCIAMNLAGIGQSPTTSLVVVGILPIVVTPADPYNRNAGESVTMNCSVSSANPAVTQIQWIRTSYSQTTILTINGIKYSGATVSNPSLTIHRLQTTDAGQYQCQAISTVGTGRGLPISLNVTGIYTTHTCDPITGGRTERCLILSTYSDYQHAYCITDSEVRARTNNTQQCSDSCRNYCLLTCMVEKYGVYNGSVTDDCRCYPTETTDSVSQIPSWCLNPQGQSNFYDECVPTRFRSCQNITEMQADLKSEIMQLSKTIADEKNCTMKTSYKNYRRCVQIVVIDELTSNDSSCVGVKTAVLARLRNECTTILSSM